MMHVLERPFLQLEHLLAPQGIKTVTTGGSEIARFLERAYGTIDPEHIRAQWRRKLLDIESARVILLGVPMDAGAGFERGSFQGPLGIRTFLHEVPDLLDALGEHGVLDLGDVRVNPHLIDDAMYTPETIASVREARGWSDVNELALPVAPHAALERVLEIVRVLQPRSRVLLLGGDHSISSVPIQVLTQPGRNQDRDLGVIHLDAHTDLLAKRDGIARNFATWAYQANGMIGRGQRMQQLGLRVSGKTREHWESTLEVRQHWAQDIHENPDAVLTRVLDGLDAVGVRRVYISNDIDGTDPTWAASTGTMEPGGMAPSFVHEVIRRAGERFEIVGSDLVEVAPPLKWHISGEPRRTLQTAAGYAVRQIEAMLGAKVGVDVPVPEPAPKDAVLQRPW